MNFLINRPNYPFNNVRVPDGLETLLRDIAREILKVQPTEHNIYDCIAAYLEKILNARQNTEDIEELLTRIINKAADIAQNLRNEGLERQKANEAAATICSCFEKFVSEKRKEHYTRTKITFEFKELDLISELIEKCKLTEKEVLRSKSMIFKAYQEFITDYMKTLESFVLPPEIHDNIMQSVIERYTNKNQSIGALNKAATKIKDDKFSLMRTRSFMLKDLQNNKDNLGTLITKAEHNISNMTEFIAATKIQRSYKKYILRKYEKKKTFSILPSVSAFSNIFKLRAAKKSKLANSIVDSEESD